jgi:hypothetical protein
MATSRARLIRKTEDEDSGSLAKQQQCSLCGGRWCGCCFFLRAINLLDDKTPNLVKL